MKTITLYFDKDWKEATKENAIYKVVRQVDDSGKLVREAFGSAKTKDKKPAGNTEKGES